MPHEPESRPAGQPGIVPGQAGDERQLLEIRDLSVLFGPVRAVDRVSLDVAPGPFGLGLVGESGSGKTTIGRAVLRLVPAASGQILFEGADVAALRGRALHDYRRSVQIVFQDPDSSLDPIPPSRPGTSTSCPAASASASRSPERSALNPDCSCSTSRQVPLTSARRRVCLT